MGQISKATIKREQKWYNPLFINFNGLFYEVGNFVFYNPSKGEVITETQRGWFDETPSLEHMEYSKMELRNKVDLTIKHPFFVRSKGNRSYDSRTMAVVYIPADVEEKKCEKIKGLAGTINKYLITDVVMDGGYKARVRRYVNTLTTPAYDKREVIAKKCNMDSYTLNGVLKVLRDEGYDVSDIISE